MRNAHALLRKTNLGVTKTSTTDDFPIHPASGSYKAAVDRMEDFLKRLSVAVAMGSHTVGPQLVHSVIAHAMQPVRNTDCRLLGHRSQL
eukprot:1942667-Amphidinium_carterae.1